LLELSVESAWRDTRRLARADTSVPAIRIRTTTPRVAIREAPTAITVDERGVSSVQHRVRFEIISPSVVAEPAQILVASGTSNLTLPVTRRGALLQADLPAGMLAGRGVVAFSFTAGPARGRWLALAIPPTDLAPRATRSFVSLVDRFTEAGIVVADSGSAAASDAAFTDRRLRARLPRDSSATIFVVAGGDRADVRIVRRDRGRADVTASRAATLGAYPAPSDAAALATLRHIGRSEREQISFCLRDALGKRVQQQLDLSFVEPMTEPPCGDAAAIREWLRVRGASIVEGPGAAVVIDRRHLPPIDTLVESWRRKRWTTARAELHTDSVSVRVAPFEDSERSRTESDTRALTAAERNAIAAPLADAALLSTYQYAATDSSDSTVAVIRLTLSPRLVTWDSSRQGIVVMTQDGSFVYGDWNGTRFVPRWEAWSYGTESEPQLIDLNGDGLDEFVFVSHGTTVKGQVTDENLWAFDHAGRELTRQPLMRSGDQWGSEQAASPINEGMTDSEYCDSDCGGLTFGPPGPDGTRPILASSGNYVLRDGRYVFRPNAPKPAAKPKPAARRARKKAGR
jgi:hypothetical protein